MNLRGNRKLGCLVALLGTCALLLSVGARPAFGGASSETSFVFNPELSLTGDCTTSEVDPVPDPECPGGVHPPAGAFRSPQAVTADSYGDIYVASYGSSNANGGEGRIDIFAPNGRFLTEISDSSGPKNVAVDSKGNLYVFQFRPGIRSQVERYVPSLYNPGAGEIDYGHPPAVVVELPGYLAGLAVDRSNDHLYVDEGPRVQEFGSAEEGNQDLDVIGQGVLNFPQGLGLAVDSSRGRIYVSDKRSTPPEDFLIDVYELQAPHALLFTIDGSDLPAGKFAFEPALAVDETSGNVFAMPEGKAVFEFSDQGAYLGAIEHSIQYVYGTEIAVDNGTASPNKGYLFVPSNPTGVGHAFAFGPREGCAPTIDSASFANVMEREVELKGTVEPCGLETSYAFRYTALSTFESQGFAGAELGGQGQIPPGGAPVPVSAAIEGLAPGTTYRFQLIATNELGSVNEEGEFTTYPAAEPGGLCPNYALRTGLAEGLPDCRAYELVTPPATNARAPRGVGLLGGVFFATREASPSGDKVSFVTEGGSIPGSEGTGSLGGDPYLSTRTSNGWTTSSAGPSGDETVALLPGSTSPDQGYSFWSTGGIEGNAVLNGEETFYVRYPDGHSAPIGRGSLGVDPRVLGRLISDGGSHIIFTTTNDHHIAAQLEPKAPPAGTEAVYDRTADEVTQVVSLLPGSKTPKPGEDAAYAGASLDGKGVAFEIGSTLYLRYEDRETYEIGESVTFAGVAEGGNRVFYLEGGRLWRFDALTEKRTSFNAGGTVIPVNVSADGSTAYFVSTSVLTTKANPLDVKAKAGQQNLYLSREGAISFIGTVTFEDVEGEVDGIGLGAWVPHIVSYGEAGEEASRTTPDGSVLLFESEAQLTGYDPEGHTEIYRYDLNAGMLTCLSCNPTGGPALGGSSVQSITRELGAPEPLSMFGFVASLRADGRRAFFESAERLVPADTDGLQDVYEWEAQGVGSCTRPQGCVFLISSGQSKRVNYLYAVSASGVDVFFRTSDLLLPADREATPSIYDARAGGGFPEEVKATCEGEGCRPNMPAPPAVISPESGAHAVRKKTRKCSKGKHAVHRRSKVRCVKHHHPPRHHHHEAGAKQKGTSK